MEYDFFTAEAAATLMKSQVAGLEALACYYKGLSEHWTHMKDLFDDGLVKPVFNFVDT